jgi:hypothetical protein
LRHGRRGATANLGQETLLYDYFIEIIVTIQSPAGIAKIG